MHRFNYSAYIETVQFIQERKLSPKINKKLNPFGLFNEYSLLLYKADW